MDVKNTDVKKESKVERVEGLLKALMEKITPDVLSHPVCFLFSLLLAKSVLLGSIAPFGLSASGALGTRKGSLWGLLGACLGYITVIDRVNSLKYIACIILIYTAHFVFSEMEISKSKIFLALSVLIPTGCINLVFLADAGFVAFDSALALFDVILATACALLFSDLRSPGTVKSNIFPVAAITLCAAMISPLGEIRLSEIATLGNIFAFSLVLLVSYTGGTGTGALVGVVFGVFASLAESSAEYSMLCGVLGIMTALCSLRGKLFACFVSVPTTFFLSVCIDPSKIGGRLFELVLSGVIFVLCANVFSRHTKHFFVKREFRRDTHIRNYATERLNLAAKAFASLGQVIADAGKTHYTEADNSYESIIKRVSGEVCKSCSLSEICWRRDFNNTKDALNKGVVAMEKNGVLSAGDFPIHFSSRCIKIEKFTNSANREIFSAKYRKKFENKIRENHELMIRQYKEAADIFASVSSDISDNAKFEEAAENALSNLLGSYGILCDTAVYRDGKGHMNVHLCGKDLSSVTENFEKFGEMICSVVGEKLSKPQYTRGKRFDDVIMRELPHLRASFGASVKRRCGSEISGDSGSFFSPENGCVALLISDGMGSGKLAAKESATAVTLLESLLKSGISPQNALNTIHSALAIKSEYVSGFATLDLMYADMFDGEAEFYKLGGATTYIKRGRHIRRITSSSLPAGVSIKGLTSPDRTTLKLIPGDFVIMTSDGISSGGDDRKIIEFLSKSDETSPKALADSLVALSLALYGKNDDMTVAAVHIEGNL